MQAGQPSATSVKAGEIVLLFVKSGVKLHPTSNKSDNIPGFLTLSRGPHATSKDIKVSFVPILTLSRKDVEVYLCADVNDLQLGLESLESATTTSRSDSHSRVFKVSEPTSSVLSGCFTAALSFIYSIQVRLPKAGFWEGSLIIHTKDGNKSPFLFFHDTESPSSQKANKLRAQNFDIFDSQGQTKWGGSDFMSALARFIPVERSTLEPSIYIVDPDSRDLQNFAPMQASRKATSDSAGEFKIANVGKFLAETKWRILETVATFSAKTKHQVKDLVEEHAPLTVKQMITNPEVQRIGNEFDSARVYLANWAQQVKQDAEQNRRTAMLSDDFFESLNRQLGSSEFLTSQEISEASRRKPVTAMEWYAFFDYSGRLSLTIDEVKSRIFHGGLDPSVRGDAWLFLLGVYPWDSSKDERECLYESYTTAYSELKVKWVLDEDKRDTGFWRDQKHRIEKDVKRTDRNIYIYDSKLTFDGAPTASDVASPSNGEEENEDDDISNITNPHLFKLREILLTFNEYNENLGYIQGMNDLLSPLYFVLRDEVLTFWAFSKFMDRMERNFVRDQLGIKSQMVTLNKLVQFMLPTLYKHLEKCESVDLLFFFRMLLVWFKREFDWDQVLGLWEILWTDYYSSQHHIFFALAILSDQERIMIENLQQFDEVLKYVNDLSMKMKIEPLVTRSELLFLKFRRMVEIIDRRKLLSGDHAADPKAMPVADDLRQLLSKKLVIQREEARPEGAGGG